MLYDANMPAKPVQISLDEDLLHRIDADDETAARGRSAFIRSAVDLYLAAKRRRLIDAQITKAYRGRADELAAETADLLDAQAWPGA
jgi:metal-responsive CopG/Arc/MetJ family transcriptional regulator